MKRKKFTTNSSRTEWKPHTTLTAAHYEYYEYVATLRGCTILYTVIIIFDVDRDMNDRYVFSHPHNSNV